jgi:hypothetical protein
MPWWDLGKFSALALLMYLVITQIQLPNLALRIAAQILAGFLLYGLLLLASDEPFRNLAIRMMERLPRS